MRSMFSNGSATDDDANDDDDDADDDDTQYLLDESLQWKSASFFFRPEITCLLVGYNKCQSTSKQKGSDVGVA